MDEQWAAILVSVITGGFGLLGIIFTQLAAKYRTKRLQPDANDVMAAGGDTRSPRLDVLMLMKHDLKAHDEMMKDNMRDIKEGIRDIARDIRDSTSDIRRDIDRIDRTH